ncbi:Trehalose-6-phosphate phosphatase [Jannaschia seosinensis]|uniref:Trehalose 6-phosphate phosphatase n=1 Tax=Jannaschia seosinensis TaxID=313367 RepID=A0A0M7B5E4_9RHOB|nr:trehalose-phosphatase [Jannaschia seosinensis]CUH13074.1 Trehalose-6-phosphate phosphatase [Jannaschia seosinensis]
MLYYQMTGFMGIENDETTDNCDGLVLPPHDEVALLLDFDGTLVEIAERPDAIEVTDACRDVLHRAYEKLDGRVALVSGRTIADLEKFLPDFEGPLIGTHGAEFRRAKGAEVERIEFDHDMVAHLTRLVDDFAVLRPEFLVEHKPSGVVLHYRQAEVYGALALNFMDSLAHAADGFRLQSALMAYEIKPETVGKDIALERLLSEPPFAGKTPVYAGDDLTDEPALDLAQKRGGTAIKIGLAETRADHRLPGPKALIERLTAWLG